MQISLKFYFCLIKAAISGCGDNACCDALAAQITLKIFDCNILPSVIIERAFGNVKALIRLSKLF